MLKQNDFNKTELSSFSINCPQGVKPKDRKYRIDIPVEKLVLWTYQTQSALEIIGRGVGMFNAEKDADGIFYKGISGDGCYIVKRNAELGTEIDCSGYAAAHIHPDAELVHDTIMSKALSYDQKGMMISYGKTGIHPDPLLGVRPSIRGRFRPNGKPIIVYEDARKRKPLFCEVEIINSPEHIEYCRALYTFWYNCLETLCDRLWELDDLMTSYNVKKPTMDEKPWAE